VFVNKDSLGPKHLNEILELQARANQEKEIISTAN
jgi:hypothetical protein